ncbi:MAG: hypothetical protein FJ288_04845 [Planctomycetes bacterium]|nr:hypothetical protein [Planctomycetota bacterium]
MRPALLAAAAAALAIFASDAFAQALVAKYEPGQVRIYGRTVKTETQTRVGRDTRRTVMEVALQRTEQVIEVRPDPPGGRILVVDVPSPQRLTAFEENGKDALAKVPEQNRSQPLPAGLQVQWRDARGQAADQPTKAAEPAQAVDFALAEMRLLPPDPLKPGDSWTREVDFGAAKASVTTKYVDQRSEGLTRCAVLSATAAVTFTGDAAKRLTVEQMSAQMTVALDGSGILAATAAATLLERADGGEQRLARTFQEKLLRSERLAAPQADKAKADMARIDRAVDQIKGKDLDGALAAIESMIQENPQPTWAPALQSLQRAVTEQRLLTQPVPLARLQTMLQDLKNNRDRAAAQGNVPQVAQLDQVIRQVSTVNLKTLLDQANDPDPINRDLSAFGLGFVQDEQAAARLLAMTKDASAQVRGTAVIATGLQGKAIEPAALVALMKDPDVRTRGAAAFLALRTLKRGDPAVDALLPHLLETLKADNPWTRLQAISALAMLAPKNSVPPAAGLIAAARVEKEERLAPVYLQALKALTDIDSSTLPPYEEWLKRQPGAPAAQQSPPAPPAEPQPPDKAPAKAKTTTPKG